MVNCEHDYDWLFDDADEPAYFLCNKCGDRHVTTAREITAIINEQLWPVQGREPRHG